VRAQELVDLGQIGADPRRFTPRGFGRRLTRPPGAPGGLGGFLRRVPALRGRAHVIDQGRGVPRRIGAGGFEMLQRFGEPLLLIRENPPELLLEVADALERLGSGRSPARSRSSSASRARRRSARAATRTVASLAASWRRAMRSPAARAA
jgi:hypothetical protein